MADLYGLQRRVDSLLARREHLHKEIEGLSEEAQALRQSAGRHTAAHTILLKIGTVYRVLSISAIENLVTTSLQAVFEHPYKFQLIPEEKRGQVELRMVIHDGNLELDPATAMGGGVVDVLSLALRLILWSKSTNRTDPIMVLDEPMRMVAEAHIANVASMFKRLSEKLGIQFIIVTHREALAYAADKAFRVTKSKNSAVTVL